MRLSIAVLGSVTLSSVDDRPSIKTTIGLYTVAIMWLSNVDVIVSCQETSTSVFSRDGGSHFSTFLVSPSLILHFTFDTLVLYYCLPSIMKGVHGKKSKCHVDTATNNIGFVLLDQLCQPYFSHRFQMNVDESVCNDV